MREFYLNKLIVAQKKLQQLKAERDNAKTREERIAAITKLSELLQEVLRLEAEIGELKQAA